MNNSISTNVTTPRSPRSYRAKATEATPRQIKVENVKLKGIESDINMVNAGIVEMKRAKEEAKIKLELRFQELQK